MVLKVLGGMCLVFLNWCAVAGPLFFKACLATFRVVIVSNSASPSVALKPLHERTRWSNSYLSFNSTFLRLERRSRPASIALQRSQAIYCHDAADSYPFSCAVDTNFENSVMLFAKMEFKNKWVSIQEPDIQSIITCIQKSSNLKTMLCM